MCRGSYLTSSSAGVPHAAATESSHKLLARGWKYGRAAEREEKISLLREKCDEKYPNVMALHLLEREREIHLASIKELFLISQE